MKKRDLILQYKIHHVDKIGLGHDEYDSKISVDGNISSPARGVNIETSVNSSSLPLHICCNPFQKNSLLSNYKTVFKYGKI